MRPDYNRPYAGLAVLYEEMGKHELAHEYSNKANRIRRREYFNPITCQNYRDLKQILDNRGIKLVCIQYPACPIEPLKRILGGEKGVIFVDNEKIFKDALKTAKRGEYFTDMFGGDFGHCTSKGNRLLAENIAKSILKEY